MPPIPPFTIDRVGQPGGPIMLVLSGDLDVLSAPILRARLLDLLALRLPLTLELRGLDFMDSSGLAALLELRSRARQVGWSVTIRGARGRVRELLERTGTLALVEAPGGDLDHAS
ncbi:STAS domain-containing protein [Candidatus Solirubrobacter pratensis]|uniref:STAS domain-containing protein n=1 Tax=Candidatus Solirubrobacter pratensis TaxID=1298857 RepID=UPI0009DBD80E|nr:STAS domain-containing protein [Candidatus Solirubrobacter pratensis]